MARAKKVTRHERKLRLALLWNDEVVDERDMHEPRPVVLGASQGAVFPLPEGVTDADVTVLEPLGEGYQLRPVAGAGGAVWQGGHRRDMADVARAGAAVPLGPTDYGVVTFGPVALFFQQVDAQRSMPRQFWSGLSASLIASIALSTFVVASCMVLSFWEYRARPPEDPLELRADVVAKFAVVPPPEELQPSRDSGTEMEDPGLRGREETGGKRHQGAAGRVGRHDATRDDTEVAGEVRDAVAAKVRNMGLLGALSGGGEGNAIAEALDVPDVSDLLGGMGAKKTTLGRGSGGAGLRGVGSGGGGDGPGSLLGAGDVGTGLGAGKGGVGAGKAGAGAPGRKRKEVKVSVTRGKPKVSGFLSPEQIMRVVRANQAAIQYCYQTELQKQPSLKGKVVVHWRIARSGQVQSARIQSSSLRNPRVEGCMVRQIRRWKFPQPDGGSVDVSFPFLFGIGG